jgi:hypothetical protein
VGASSATVFHPSWGHVGARRSRYSISLAHLVRRTGLRRVVDLIEALCQRCGHVVDAERVTRLLAIGLTTEPCWRGVA